MNLLPELLQQCPQGEYENHTNVAIVRVFIGFGRYGKCADARRAGPPVLAKLERQFDE